MVVESPAHLGVCLYFKVTSSLAVDVGKGSADMLRTSRNDSLAGFCRAIQQTHRRKPNESFCTITVSRRVCNDVKSMLDSLIQPTILG